MKTTILLDECLPITGCMGLIKAPLQTATDSFVGWQSGLRSKCGQTVTASCVESGLREAVEHHDVAHKMEFRFVANLCEFFDEDVAGPSGLEQRQAPVTTEGDEMQMASAVIALESSGHVGP